MMTGLEVLENVAVGRSVWHGYDAGTVARTGEVQVAYAARQAAILGCRERGLLTDDNLLTDQGRAVLKAMGRVHG